MILFTKPMIGLLACVGLVSTAIPYALAKPAKSGSALEAKLKSIAASGTRVTASIVNLSNNTVLLNFNENSPLNPASSIKLFTAYTALKKLGINFTFKTAVQIKSDQSLCVKGGGDPSFVMEDLYLLVQMLKRKGLESYSGKITLDASAFDEEMYSEERTEQNSERAYNAPISGLNFNYNTISVFVNPRNKGEPAKLGLDFPFDFVKIEGKVMTGTGTDVTWDKKGKGDLEIVSLGGKIAADAPEWRKPFRIRNPSMAFGEALSKMLESAGISAKGKVIVLKGSCNANVNSDAVYESKPLSYIVQLMDKYSNNFIADSLVKVLDHEVNHKIGTAEGGIKVVRAELKRMGIDVSVHGRNYVSGSGLTRDNSISASDFISLLKQVYHEKLVWPEFLTSLPLASVDGTLKRKYAHTDAEARLRGKTGTLNEVQSLVGVYPDADGNWIGVAVVVNGSHSIPEKELGDFLGKN
ncbi:MAG: D-alanyl-D-alanine carboxypeptidase/D-alanyl-D-alanine-endopeptidase [Bdellovibrionales bacterium]|nr:D-alanyl-D-alanine carboxypeptidase/D-alanyl-D-alanine-endopeptidase [Oligoflexia bacterium]